MNFSGNCLPNATLENEMEYNNNPIIIIILSFKFQFASTSPNLPETWNSSNRDINRNSNKMSEFGVNYCKSKSSGKYSELLVVYVNIHICILVWLLRFSPSVVYCKLQTGTGLMTLYCAVLQAVLWLYPNSLIIIIAKRKSSRNRHARTGERDMSGYFNEE